MAYHRKIKCPRHFIVKPGLSPWKRIPNPKLKDLPEWAFKKWPSLRRTIIERDRWGRPIREDRNFYQPYISAAFAVSQIYDPMNPICQRCNVKCTEGINNKIATIGRRIPKHAVRV